MTQDIFWQLIDKARAATNINFETQCVTLTELLTPYNKEDIIDFEHILREKIEEASSFEIMAATFLVCSFISDDTYEDFRAWLVGQGKDNFYKAIKNPDDVADMLSKKQAQNLGGEFMLFVAVNAYLEKTGSDDDEAFYQLIEHPEEKEIKQQWPESKAEYRKILPHLFDKFWDEDRIAAKLKEAEENGEDD